MSIKGCRWEPAGHYTERAHSVNPCAFTAGFLSSSPPRALFILSSFHSWHDATLGRDYLPAWLQHKSDPVNDAKGFSTEQHTALCFICGGICFWFVRRTTSSLLSSHNSAGLTHIGFSVGSMGRRKLGANQVAPGRKSSFYGCVIVSHTYCQRWYLGPIWTFYR